MEMWLRAWAGNFNLSSFFRSFHHPILHGLSLTTAICWAYPGPTLAADTSERSNRVIHATPARLADRLASFQLAPGFKIDLIATEPMVSAPVAIAFDENGRLFVAEMRDYPNRDNASPHLGRVRVLTDPDAEGVYQTSTVYTEDLRWPSAIACYAGGVFVVTAPDIFYFRDGAGDGTADMKRLVLTGFGNTNDPNVESLPNSLAWGLDNRFHGVTAGIGGVLTASNWPSGPISLTGCDFAFAPRSLESFRETGPGRSGLTFDEAGRRFISDDARPLRLPMYDVRYTDRNPFYAKPPAIIDVANPAPQILELKGTKIESSSTAPGSFTQVSSTANTNLLSPAWMAHVRGSLIYRGRIFPTNYYGNVFIPDREAHVVQRLLLHENGLEAVAEKPREEMKSEFLLSRDPSFRPVQAVSGPDGALYVVDMQNGDERGRIYRIAPVNFKPSKPPQLGKARTYDLVVALAGADGWYCDTAGRLLYERHDPASVPLLTNMLANSRLALARLRALHGLGGLHSLSEADVIKALHDTDSRVREHAVLLSEQLTTNGVVSPGLWGELKALADDPAIRVRYQLAFTAGQIARVDKAIVLSQILRRDLNNSWIRNAVLSSVAEGAGDLFLVLASDVRFRNGPVGHEFLRRLTTMIGTTGHLDEVRQVIKFLAQTQLERLQMFGFAAGLGEGLHYTRSSFSLLDPQGTLQSFYARAFQSAIDSFTPPAIRIEAIHFIAAGPGTYTDTSDWLLALCNPQPSGELRAAAIAALTRYDDPRVVGGLIERWPLFPSSLRNYALTRLLTRRSLVPFVMEAAANRRVAITDFTSPQLDFLRSNEDPTISDSAERVFGRATVRRPATIDQFKQALRLRGIPEHGRDIFQARCADCHRLEGIGQTFGPDLAATRVKGKEKLLADIIEPGAEIASGHGTCVIATFEGENLIGIKADENSTTITLLQPRGESVVVPRLNAQLIRNPSWSSMPLGLEQGLSTQDFADLLEYLMTVPRS